MDEIKQLVKTNQLKTSFLSSLPAGSKLFFHFDDLSDTLMLMFVPLETQTIVHYLDRYVSILYTPNKYEIVGLQIEDFDKEFVPMYSELQKEWCLSHFGISDSNVWDLTLQAKEKQLKVAMGIVKAKEKVIGQPAEIFEKALEYA